MARLQWGDPLAQGELQCIASMALLGQQAGKEALVPVWSKDTDQLLLYQGKLYVPPQGGVRVEILCIHHDDPVAGHFRHV